MPGLEELLHAAQTAPCTRTSVPGCVAQAQGGTTLRLLRLLLPQLFNGLQLVRAVTRRSGRLGLHRMQLVYRRTVNPCATRCNYPGRVLLCKLRSLRKRRHIAEGSQPLAAANVGRSSNPYSRGLQRFCPTRVLTRMYPTPKLASATTGPHVGEQSEWGLG